ncbi:Na+/H+ antiporter subunit E [Paracoccus seriniphilus]|uniref:Multisubunit potassium/proton antiporter, PhaE subunit n=1 Tax=Paracoccus seriniphilus TaxID=184748 RepID=A0A239Q269_9RHOB|nr:Na+/H+ antiporter subunit E [Paracoccus seriniphilus]WCR14551.1 Na+/H+ antiporter subunit E [Paracoccus seriniphilus]SNT76585.1 multisubunit potassium/proton antiporter, PhaE subunit [Paracoccus seriniphilus]
MIRRIFPHPYLSALLVLIWMLLVNRFAWGSLVFALILSIAIPALTEPYWPDRARVRHPFKIMSYVLLVIYDIIVANVQVALIVLFKANRNLNPAWISVPLDLRSPEAITVLAGTITLTPGTVSADLSQDGHALLVHCLHAPDPESVILDIKSRYEDRLKEIFE